MNPRTWNWIFRVSALVAYAVIAVVVVLTVLSLFGCAHCEPKVITKEVVVKVPVEVKPQPLPVPAPVDCAVSEGSDEQWRNSAQYIKDCFDSLVKKIEEYSHIIESFNKSLEDTP